MKRGRIHTLLLLCALLLTLRAAASFATEPKALTIFGISKLVVGADSIQVTKDSSLPSGLDLIPGKGGTEAGVKNLAVNVGDSFTVSDRHHASATYRLLRITSGSALVEEIRSASFPGTKEHRNARTMLIRNYGLDVSGQ
jgi:hypothetical protein